MRSAVKILVFFSFLFIWNTASAEVFKDITVSEANELIKKRSDLTIIDVRTPEEYGEGHIAGALNIDFRNPDFKKNISALDRGKGYVVYCRSGKRSKGAHDAMKELGFKEVYNILEGIIGWTEAGLPVTK